jgi:hypothetical protein
MRREVFAQMTLVHRCAAQDQRILGFEA